MNSRVGFASAPFFGLGAVAAFALAMQHAPADGAEPPLAEESRGPRITLAQNAPPAPDSIAPPSLITPGNGRRTIMSKLESIQLDVVAFDNLPLEEVVRFLSDESRKRDPEGKGINFLLSANASTAGLLVASQIDPTTGFPLAGAPIEAIDINAIPIRISPALNDLRLLDVLNLIVKLANPPIRYTVEDYAIVFSLRGGAASSLETRVFKVDPNTFDQGLESVVGITVGNITSGAGGGGQAGAGTVTIPRVVPAPAGVGAQGGINGVTRRTKIQDLRQFFSRLGVDLAPPKSVAYEEHDNLVMVVATHQDLEIIQAALNAAASNRVRRVEAAPLVHPK